MPTIRIATREDLSRIHPVIERAYRGILARAGWTHEADLIEGDRTDLETLSSIIENPSEHLLIAEENGVAMGNVQISDHGNGVCYLGLLSVDPSLQTGGLGKQLIAAAEDVARSDFGATLMEMTVIDTRLELIDFYIRRGYVLTGESRPFPIPLDPPLAMVVLAKQLV